MSVPSPSVASRVGYSEARRSREVASSPGAPQEPLTVRLTAELVFHNLGQSSEKKSTRPGIERLSIDQIHHLTD